ncbi:MAG TPA: iron uptake system protein EfeO [Jatrophihabitans sp.]|jgi:iron uptake system component EfeO
MPAFNRSAAVLSGCILAATLALTLLAGCSSTSKTQAAGAVTALIHIELTNDGCKASPAQVPAGPAKFSVRNNGGSAVSEAELVSGTKILGEKEGLTPGLTGTFSLDLAPGDYETYCPHAKTERSPFKVTGTASSARTAATGAAAALASTGEQYRQYVQGKAETLIASTTVFVSAVKAGDVVKAKSLYAAARAPYETIEPVAESFGDLDPDIDARDGDVPAAQWRGYHRIEKQLWVMGNTMGMAPVADQLLSDVNTLASKIKSTSFQPAELANGATELLNEVAKSKLTGEEERYSRTDISDIDANVEGSQAAFDLLAPAMKILDAGLTSQIQAKFSDLRTIMQKYSSGNGTYKPYTDLSDAHVKELSTAVNALAEPLSRVAEQIVAIN